MDSGNCGDFGNLIYFLHVRQFSSTLTLYRKRLDRIVHLFDQQASGSDYVSVITLLSGLVIRLDAI